VVAAWTELPPTGGLPECAALVQLAERLRWSAAELVIQYASRALTESAAEGGPLAVRAHALAAAALVRLGRHADAVEPAVAALRDADQAGVPELVPAIRLDLAACAHGLGESLLGCTILGPVLENAAARPSTRAIAMTALVGCTAHVGRRDDLEDALAEAERLLAADDALAPDARRMERAQLAMRTAAYYRRYGETEDAVEAARSGLGSLAKLRDPRLEGGLARAGLVLELVCALLDDGELAEAEAAAGPLLAEPVRAASAAPVGRLVLAMVTRVHVPAGRVELGRSLLGHASWLAERYEHDWLLADALNTLAELDEAAGQPTGALHALRAARMAEQAQARRVDAARRQLMIEFGARPMALDAVNSLLRGVVRAQVSPAVITGSPAMLPPARPPVPQAPKKPEPPVTDEATGLLTREGLSQRLQAARSTNRSVALTLVRLDAVDGEARPGTDQDTPAAEPPPEALTTLAGRVRDIAPEDAELARSDGSELAVLLPHTTRDEAEEFAATIRESAIESDWLTKASGHEVSISTGVAHTGTATDGDADSLLTAARETLTPAEAERPGPTVPEAPSSEDLFLSTLEAAAGDPSAGYQEIRALLAPLLGHPSLRRSATEPGTTAEPEPRPTPPEPETPRQGEVARRQTVPEPEREPDDIPEPPRRPDRVSPKDPDPFPVTPEEPDAIPPVPPGPEPIPDVPGPTTFPATPEPELAPPTPEPEPAPPAPEQPRPEPKPQPQPQPQPQQQPEESRLEAILGPVQGPEPRPDDLPSRSLERPLRRPDRSETTSIAELLTEALVAYQESAPDDDDPPTNPILTPVTREPTYHETQPTGRHRMPDWDGGF
jgi:GGDEF domain-containing protein/tetratricopeptide (TPR) repeat protein